MKSKAEIEQSLSEAVSELLDQRECRIVKKEDNTVYKIEITRIGQKRGKHATVEEINKAISNGLNMESGTKRIYRRKEDLPNPEFGSQHTSNRATKFVGTRVAPEYAELFSKCASKFSSKREALERAIALLAEHDPPEPDA